MRFHRTLFVQVLSNVVRSTQAPNSCRRTSRTERTLLSSALIVCLAAGSSYAQQAQPPHNPADSIPAPAPVSDSALRQTTPAPQSRGEVINAGWLAHHEKNVAEAKNGSHDLLFVGDSITDNFHKAGPAPDQLFKPIWDELFAPHGALNLGVSGDSTQHVLWRLDHGEVDGLAPSNIVMMIGTNNTWHDGKASAQDVAGGIEAVVASLHRHMPRAKILIVAILPSTVGAGKTEKDEAINAIVAKSYAHRDYVRTLDLKPLFMKNGALDSDLFYDTHLTPPGRASVHPNSQGQRIWAQAVAKALFGETSK